MTLTNCFTEIHKIWQYDFLALLLREKGFSFWIENNEFIFGERNSKVHGESIRLSLINIDFNVVQMHEGISC